MQSERERINHESIVVFNQILTLVANMIIDKSGQKFHNRCENIVFEAQPPQKKTKLSRDLITDFIIISSN